MPDSDVTGRRKNPRLKKRLGRGLDSLFSTQDRLFGSEQTSSALEEEPLSTDKKASFVFEKRNDNSNLYNKIQAFSLPIEKIIPNQNQPRKDFSKESLEELSLSIKEKGVLQPIVVRRRGEKFEIIAGERRWRACQKAGLKELPAILKEVDHRESMEMAMIENLQRENLNPLEEAMGYQALMDEYRLSQQELGKKLGKSRSTIANSLRILGLTQYAKQMLNQNLLSFGHGKLLLSVSDEKIQTQLVRKTLNEKWSVRTLEKEIRKIRKKQSTPLVSNGSEQKQVHKMAENLQKALGTKVDIQYKKGKGKVSIIFYSDGQLCQLYEKIKDTRSSLL